MIDLPSLDPVDAAIAKLGQSLSTVESHILPVVDAAGFVVAEDIRSDRESPALDVSAMDGFAIRLGDFLAKPLPIAGVAAAGRPPLSLPARSAIRIFTGAPVPNGADTVIVRECSRELNNEVDFEIDVERIQQGQHIRKRGENASVQHLVLSAHSYLSAKAMASLATFGPPHISVYRKIRVSIINTGDELVGMGEKAEAWQIRDSNGPYLEQFLRQQPWVGEIERRSVGDDPVELKECILDGLARADVVLLTGGVSMGDYDYVPEMIRQSGCRIEFHRLPIRPGKPVLGAVGPKGQMVCGLPGNPISVAVTARRIAVPLMRKVAGLPMADSIRWCLPAPEVSIASIDLIHYRLCNINDSGECEWTPMMGSGDIVALTQSDGFLELPPNYRSDQSAEKRYRFYPW